MSRVIRLFQEGVVRPEGYQLSQWVAVYPENVSTDALQALFVFRKTSSGEAFERVASLTDFVAYPVNEINAFEIYGPDGINMFSLAAGQQLLIPHRVDHWLQQDPPYANAWFEVASFSDKNGVNPQLLVGNVLSLSDYEFTPDDTGRCFQLAGFGNSTYNAVAYVRQILGRSTARVGFIAAPGTSVGGTATGASWKTRIVHVTTNVDPAQEPRYFPTVERGLEWEIYDAARLNRLAFGKGLSTRRENDGFAVYRSVRVTTMEPSSEAAVARRAVVRAAVARLQQGAAVVETEFLGVEQTDFPE